MARQVHEVDYTTEDLDALLEKADKKPFVIWHDEEYGLYRFFPNKEKKDIWVEAWINKEMTEEIAEYEFVPAIVAPAPYSISINNIIDNQYVLEGTTAPPLSFTFKTLDSKEQEISESVDVYYTFRSPSGTKTASAIYNAGVTVQFNVDGYISLGTNNITILIRGRSTGTTKTVVVTYNVIKLELSSTFDISRPVERNVDFDVQFTINGGGNKTVKIYIDGNGGEYNTEISELVPLPATKIVKIPNDLTPGKHTLQIKASVIANSTEFYSNLLYYEFEVRGADDTRTLISEIFPPTQTPFIGNIPGLRGEQYVIKKLNWAYYSSNSQFQNATIQWRLFTEGGTETTLATRTADVVDAEIGTPPEPLSFMPTEEGDYKLQALILDSITGEPIGGRDNPTIFGEYTISVIKNTSGIIETTEGLTMKLSGLGRDNSEPELTRNSWTDRGHGCTFYNMPFNNIAGYINNAVVFNNGAYGIINNKPFSSDNPPTNNGAVFEIDFETFDVDDEDTPLVQIGNKETKPYFLITPTKAILVSFSGKETIAQFKSDERVKLCFIIYPSGSSAYRNKTMLFINGVMSNVIEYAPSDNYNIGNSESGNFGKIIVGDEDGNAGIKIYYMRTYSQFITMYEELNNYFIDSGENLAKLVAKNDIYNQQSKELNIDKLETTITTVKVTGDLQSIIGKTGKGKVICKLEVVSPFDSNINMHCDKAQFGNAGQSTLDKPIPSFHVKLDKASGNICYDRDNKILPKNRWAFRVGNVPEKKFRLQANFMDSSNAHNGAFFRMINNVFPEVKITVDEEEKHVLRMPAEEYVINQYSEDMQQIHGDDPHENNWKFPYNMHMVPDSIPCIVVYRLTENTPFTFLGQYVLMEEKKSNYANGMHSIYDGLDNNNNPDPFGFNSSKSENRLWDNTNCHQYELLTSTDLETLFLDDSNFEENRENTFELIYPDEDDLTPTEITAEWNKFKTEFLSVISSFITKHSTLPPSFEITEESQEEFNDFYLNGKLINNHTIKLDRWHFAAYYSLVLRNCCSDSTARNMEITTYDGVTWLPKWWDVDMQCGLSQTNKCDLLPCMDRTSKIPGTNVYAISGRIQDENGYRSSALWDLLENCPQFIEDVKIIEKALYDAGWTYANMTKIQDEEFVEAWSQALYNESSITKYINTNDLVSLQGDRTSHRHWFLKTSYDYWDSVHASGEYEKNIIIARTLAPQGSTFKVTPGRDSYLGWGTSISSDVVGVKVNKGVEHEFEITRALQYNNPLHIFGASNLESVDLSNISTTIAAELRLAKVYDEITGTLLKSLIIGTPFVEEDPDHEGRYNITFNTNSSFDGFTDGADILTRLETLSIQGLTGWKNISMEAMSSLKNFYAGGSSLQTFIPANSTQFEILELPTSIVEMTMTNCNLTDENDNCIIKWFETSYDYQLTSSQPVDWNYNYRTYFIKVDDEYINVLPEGEDEHAPTWSANTYYKYVGYIQQTTTSTNLYYLYFEGMGTDKGTQELILNWLNGHADAETDFSRLRLYYKNVNWSNLSVNDLMLIARIPRANRSITGKIVISGTITSQDIVNIKEAFGDDVFDKTPGSLSIDAAAGLVIGAPTSILAGNTVQITAVVFPTSQSDVEINYILGRYVEDVFQEYSYSESTQTYQKWNVTLHRYTGELIVRETNQDTHSVVVRASTEDLGYEDIEIEIQKRIYPETVELELVENPKITYDEIKDQYYVVDDGDDGINISINVITTPLVPTGTELNYSWDIDEEISSIINIIDSDTNSIILNVSECPEDVIEGLINYTRNYVDGTTVTNSINFAFKSPKAVVKSEYNQPLQDGLNEAGVAQKSSAYTYDTELWGVYNLNNVIDYVKTTIKHLGELNEFINITELDLNGCTSLGSISIQQRLEDGQQHYVDVIPARDINLTLDLSSVDLRNTQVRGINLKENSSLEEIHYSDYTTEVKLINQDSLEEVDLTVVADDCDMIIDNCDNLETLNI